MAILPLEKPKRRKISPDIVLAIAQFNARMINDTEACNTLGIRPQTWFNWKGRPANLSKYGDILSRVRAAKIDAHLNNIEAKSDKDWRASEAYLRLTEPDRFGDKSGQNGHVTVNAQDSQVTVLINKVYGNTEQKARITGASPAQVCDVATQVSTDQEQSSTNTTK